MSRTEYAKAPNGNLKLETATTPDGIVAPLWGKCSSCGENYSVWSHSDMLESGELRPGICFECNFWFDKVEMAEEFKSIRAVYDNEHYMVFPIADEKRIPSSCLGYGGAHFAVLFNDGRVLYTNNLRSNGRVPMRFRDRLPNNALYLGPPMCEIRYCEECGCVVNNDVMQCKCGEEIPF